MPYVPVVKSKKNDLDAVSLLSPGARALTKPLVEAPVAIVDKQLTTDLARAAISAKNLSGPFYFDPLNLEIEYSQLEALNALASGNCEFTPAFGLQRLPKNVAAVRSLVQSCNLGVCFRIEFSDLDQAPEDVWARVIDYSAWLELSPGRVEIIIDMARAIPYPVKSPRDSVLDFLTLRPKSFQMGSIAIIGSSAPSSIAAVQVDGFLSVGRTEVELWADLNFELGGTTVLGFGDYGIVGPHFTFSGPNPNANAKIRYTEGIFHRLFRGHGLYNPSRFPQYFELSKRVVDSPYYRGAGFSFGDGYIADCASHNVGPGNLGTWVKVDSNHHMEYVARQADAMLQELAHAESASDVAEILVELI